MGWVYGIFSPSGKVYIGQTIHDDPNKRWNQEKTQKRGALVNVFRKYGANACEFKLFQEISLKTHGSRWQEFLDFWEKTYIHSYDAMNQRYGYNRTTGGKYNYAFHYDVRLKISEKAKNRVVSEETKQKLKKTPEQREVLRLLATGRKHTSQAKKKISAWGKGRPKSEECRAKIKESSLKTGRTEEQKQATAEFNRKTKSKKIQQFTSEGILVKTYDSQREAARETGINNTGISKCARGDPKHPKAGGFIWKFTEI